MKREQEVQLKKEELKKDVEEAIELGHSLFFTIALRKLITIEDILEEKSSEEYYNKKWLDKWTEYYHK